MRYKAQSLQVGTEGRWTDTTAAAETSCPRGLDVGRKGARLMIRNGVK